MRETRVFLALPQYGPVDYAVSSAVAQASCEAEVLAVPHVSSLLPFCFNQLWATALNQRTALGLTHFAMLHADVLPLPGWLDVLLQEQARAGADVLSAVIPIKDDRGLTSTGVYQARDGTVRRLSLAEVHTFPQTFGMAAIGGDGLLMVNTGCWVCDFTQPWVDSMAFKFRDGIVKLADGTFQARNFPEDWDFSLQCAERGLRVMATRAVGLAHVGLHEWRNDSVWGTQQTDAGGR